MEEKNEKLFVGTYIPESRARDIFAGFGIMELAITGVVALIAVIIAIISYMNTEQILYSLIICLGIVSITVMAVLRNRHDESLIDQLLIVIKYYRAQKQFEPETKNYFE